MRFWWCSGGTRLTTDVQECDNKHEKRLKEKKDNGGKRKFRTGSWRKKYTGERFVPIIHSILFSGVSGSKCVHSFHASLEKKGRCCSLGIVTKSNFSLRGMTPAKRCACNRRSKRRRSRRQKKISSSPLSAGDFHAHGHKKDPSKGDQEALPFPPPPPLET